MSTSHKAFIIASPSFFDELKPLIESSLLSGDISALREFISNNISLLSDPYEGEPLNEDWEGLIETPDAHQYGDFALTKYYSPALDRGIGYEWEELQELFTNQFNSPTLLLGRPLGQSNNYFDPGKIGSYFKNPEEVRSDLHKLQEISDKIPSHLISPCMDFKKLLHDAANGSNGLYVTF